MSALSEMPVVTVEQVVRFREAALRVQKERDELLAALIDAANTLDKCRYSEIPATERARAVIARIGAA